LGFIESIYGSIQQKPNDMDKNKGFYPDLLQVEFFKVQELQNEGLLGHDTNWCNDIVIQ
jgi:hypothetical protein